ncbi:unnamed protein product [Pieris macdunnoughi]|uniref:Uncharacterized protein n=1 Tax=Pieris macdunnoughi TaxID=345717 RepID=A0A821QZJ8_9NEOP|nr:unnamed protein product [Pieris macdunnoughi]
MCWYIGKDKLNITVEITTDESSEVEIQIDEREATPSAAESVPISASVAISGQLPSSQELPYITPPSPRPIPEPAVHFSGDSTDSAKGYTSISVREPLSNIRAQTIKPSQPHYATVSDDSGNHNFISTFLALNSYVDVLLVCKKVLVRATSSGITSSQSSFN